MIIVVNAVESLKILAKMPVHYAYNIHTGGHFFVVKSQSHSMFKLCDC